MLHLQEMVGRDDSQIDRLEAELKLSKKEVKTLAAERNARDEQLANLASHATTLEQELQQLADQVRGTTLYSWSYACLHCRTILHETAQQR